MYRFRSILIAFLIASPLAAQTAPPVAPSVDSLVAEALAKSPSLAAARSRLAAARDMEPPASALADPMVEAMVQNADFPNYTIGTEDMSMAGFEVRQPLPYPGKRRARAESAHAETALRETEIAELERRVTAEVRTLYGRVYAMDRERQSLSAARELVELLTATASARYASGESEQESLLKAQLQVTRLEEQLDDLEAERQALVAELNRWLDRPGEEPLGEITALPAVQDPAGPWEARAVEASPRVRVSRAAVAAAERRVAVARLDLKPDFAPSAGFAVRGALGPVLTLRVGVELPFWKRQKQEPRIRAAEAEARDGPPRGAGCRVHGPCRGGPPGGRVGQGRAPDRSLPRGHPAPDQRRLRCGPLFLSRRPRRLLDRRRRLQPLARSPGATRPPRSSPLHRLGRPGVPHWRPAMKSKTLYRCLIALFVALLLIPVVGCGHPEEEGGKYYCPMHPDYHSDKPGDCPICGMRLVLAEKKDAEPAAARPAAPAQDAARVPTSTEGFRLAGVQTAVAERQSLSRTTRAAGVVVADETRVRHVHTKVAGYIEKLYVNYTGQQVRKGQPLLSIYSPELLATQRELLRAKEIAERFSRSALPEVRRGGEELLEAARQRLELLDVPPGFISRLESTGQAQRAVTLTAPASGFVTGKEIFEGQEVQPGLDVLTLTDLSRVWIEADFYEYESRSLRLGEKATVSLPYDPGVRLTGRVAFVYPVLDPQTRTVKVRLEFPNPGLALKPGMYVDVTPEARNGRGGGHPRLRHPRHGLAAGGVRGERRRLRAP